MAQQQDWFSQFQTVSDDDFFGQFQTVTPTQLRPNIASRSAEFLQGPTDLFTSGIRALTAPFNPYNQARAFESLSGGNIGEGLRRLLDAEKTAETASKVGSMVSAPISALGDEQYSPYQRLVRAESMLLGMNPDAIQQDWQEGNYGALAADVGLPVGLGLLTSGFGRGAKPTPKPTPSTVKGTFMGRLGNVPIPESPIGPTGLRGLPPNPAVETINPFGGISRINPDNPIAPSTQLLEAYFPEIVQAEGVFPVSEQLQLPMPRLQLPAIGESSASGPTRFFGGRAGVADANMAYPANPFEIGPFSGTILPEEFGSVIDIGPQLAADRGIPYGLSNPNNPRITRDASGRFSGITGGPISIQGIPRELPPSPLAFPEGGSVVREPIVPDLTTNPREFGFRANRLTPEESRAFRENRNPPIFPETQRPFSPYDIHVTQAGPSPKPVTPREPVFEGFGVMRASPNNVRNAAGQFTGVRGQSLREMLSKAAQNKPIPPSDKRAVIDEQRNSNWVDVLNVPRSIKSIWDLSAPFRQGLNLVHTKAFWTSFDDMIKAAGSSREGYHKIMQSITEAPEFGKLKEMGIDFTDLLSKREEAMMSQLVEKYVPGARHSNQAYTAFLNKLRFDHGKRMIDLAEKAGVEPSPYLMKEMGNFINNATGRGSLGSLGKYAGVVNGLLFSPRFIASRVRMMNPNNFVQIGKEYGAFSPEANFMRKQYLKSFLATAGLTSAFVELGKLFGGEVSNDPTSSDFRKLKIGDTRIDPYAGYQQYLVAGANVLDGVSDIYLGGQTPRYGADTPLTKLGRSAYYKLNPPAAFGLALLHGKDPASGQPITIGSEAERLFMPMIVESLKEVYQEDPELLPIVAPLNFFGVGSQTYVPRSGGNVRFIRP